MNRKAIFALCIAVLIPVISYILVKKASDAAVDIPGPYLLDSVVSRRDADKIITDSIWHKTANIRLVNQLGDTVNLYDIKNRMIVMDFFFTSCGSICPKLTKNMAKLQQSFIKGGDAYHPEDSTIVQFVSITIDPDRDSVSRLKQYADKYGVNHDNWWMLTGNRDSIYNFIFQELKVDKYNDQGPVDPNFAHTSRLVLLDKNFVAREHTDDPYNGLDSVSVGRLAKDIATLSLSKEENPEPLPFDPVLMGIFFVITGIIAVTGTKLIFRKKNNNN